MAEEEMNAGIASAEKKKQRRMRTKTMVFDEDVKIDLFEISPRGLLISALIDGQIFIKVLNQVERDQWVNSLGYH